MDTEPAVSYRAAVPGTPVLTRSGKEIGTLEHVLGVPDEDLFDGLVVATDWGLRFVDASEVEALVRVANLDALVSERPYKKAWPVDEGIEFLKSQRGKHFDPTVIDAFLSDRGAIETVLREFAD